MYQTSSQHPTQYGYNNGAYPTYHNNNYAYGLQNQYSSYPGRPVQSNQNYYQSPIIQNPPINQSSYNYGINDPYSNYYGQYYGRGHSGNYGYANYGNYEYPYNNYYANNNQGECTGCQQNQSYYQRGYGHQGGCNGCQGAYSYSYLYNQHGSKKDCGCGCGGQGKKQYQKKDCGCGCKGAGNCAEYGLSSFNRGRLTPQFPSKLGHSFITSGDKVQNKLVINQPNVQSAPFQSQRRKTYQPFTRKYLQYQDYIQYNPVQRSQWQYKKVLKQIDFVPQQYYQSQLQYIPIQKINQKIKYLPVEQQILHVPQDIMRKVDQKGIISNGKRQNFGKKFDTYKMASTVNNPGSLPNGGPYSKVTINNHQLEKGAHQILRQNFQVNSLIHPGISPAVSTVQMVPNTRFQSTQQQQIGGPSQFLPSNPNIPVQNSSKYKFPQRGVIIGSTTQQNNTNTVINPAFNSFGPQNPHSNISNQQLFTSNNHKNAPQTLNPIHQALVNKTNSQIVENSIVNNNYRNSRQYQNQHQQFNNPQLSSNSSSDIIRNTHNNQNIYRDSRHNQYEQYSYDNDIGYQPQKKKSLVDNIEYDYYN